MYSSTLDTCIEGKCGGMTGSSEHLPISRMNLLSSSSVFDSEVRNWHPLSGSMQSEYAQSISVEQALPVKHRQLDLTHVEQQPLLQPWTSLASSPVVELASIKPVITEPLRPGSLPAASFAPAQTETESSVLEPTLLEQCPQGVHGIKETPAELIDVQTINAVSISVRGMAPHVEQTPRSPVSETISVIRVKPGYMMYSSEETMSKESIELERRKHLEDKNVLRETAEVSFDSQEPIEMEQVSNAEMALPVVPELDLSEPAHIVEKEARHRSFSLEMKGDFSIKSPGCLINAPASESITATIQCNVGNQKSDEIDDTNIAADRESDSYRSSAVPVCYPIVQAPSSGPSSSDSESLEITSVGFRHESCDKPNANSS